MATDLLADLAARTQRAVPAVVPAGAPVALVNFPNHRNAGDPALWLGGLRAVQRAGARVRYVCDPESWTVEPLAHVEETSTLFFSNNPR